MSLFDDATIWDKNNVCICLVEGQAKGRWAFSAYLQPEFLTWVNWHPKASRFELDSWMIDHHATFIREVCVGTVGGRPR